MLEHVWKLSCPLTVEIRSFRAKAELQKALFATAAERNAGLRSHALAAGFDAKAASGVAEAWVSFRVSDAGNIRHFRCKSYITGTLIAILCSRDFALFGI